MKKKRKEIYNLFVKGVPIAQSRPRLGKYGNFYSNSPSVKAWKEEIMASFAGIRRPMITEAVHLKVYFYMPVPKGMKIDTKKDCYVPHIKTPDTDNLLKAVMDAITKVGVWKDDALVFWSEQIKWYAAEETGARIIIETGF